MSDPEAALRARNLRTLALLAALFLLPLLLAFCTYYGSSWRPAGSVNHGVLIQPPRPLPALQFAPATPESPAPNAAGLFRGRWSLVYVGDGACEAACRETLYVMRQTRLALNNDMTRVARVFLVTGHCCAPGLAQEHAGLMLLNAQEAAAPLLQQFPPLQREHTLFIVDPLGNLMMSYDARQNPRGLLEDLKKLLRLSHIG